MSTYRFSSLLWIVGGIVGATIATKHRVWGGILGAILAGAIGDKMIENHQARRNAITN